MAPHLRKVEKNVLIPRYMEYKITHELCSKEAKEFADCARASGLKVIITCRDLRNKFEECSNKWWNDEEFKKQMEDEYLEKRKRFRETGEAEKSPFKRL